MESTSDYIVSQDIQTFPFNIERCSHVFKNKPSEQNPTTIIEFAIDLQNEEHK